MPRQKKINPAVLYFPERIQTALGYLKVPLTQEQNETKGE